MFGSAIRRGLSNHLTYVASNKDGEEEEIDFPGRDAIFSHFDFSRKTINFKPFIAKNDKNSKQENLQYYIFFKPILLKILDKRLFFSFLSFFQSHN